MLTQPQPATTTDANQHRANAILADLRETLMEMSGSELLWIKANSNARTKAMVDQELDRRSSIISVDGEGSKSKAIWPRRAAEPAPITRLKTAVA